MNLKKVILLKPDLREVLDELCGKDQYRINEGDGAFYGPKIDIKMKDCLGREWQMGSYIADKLQTLSYL